MRENLVKQAVSFLTNPGTQSTPTEKKKAFLESKGLTAEEIAEAQRRVETKGAEPAASAAAPGSPQGVPADRREAVALAPPQYAGGPAEASGHGTVHVGPAAAATSSQAVLLLRRRLADIEHERGCLLEALRMLGDPSVTAGGRVAAALPLAVAAPAAAAALASATPALAPPAPAPGPPSPEAPPPPPPAVPTPAAKAAPARKPWEVAPRPSAPAASTGEAPLRDDDPDLMDIIPPAKKDD